MTTVDHQRILAAGWTLQLPDLNLFKQMLRENACLKLVGIVYPKRTLQALEGVPIFEPEEAAAAIKPGDLLVDCSQNKGLAEELVKRFAPFGLKPIALHEALRTIARADRANEIVWPLQGLRSSMLLEEAPELDVGFFSGSRFLDDTSHRLACDLKDSLGNFKLYAPSAYDQDTTIIFELADWLMRFGARHPRTRFAVLDSPLFFMEAIIECRRRHPEVEASVHILEGSEELFLAKRDFWTGCLDGSFYEDVPVEAMPSGKDVVFLCGSPERWVREFAGKDFAAVLTRMPRSILDLPYLQRIAGANGPYAVALKQTCRHPASLLGAVVRVGT